MYRIDEKFVDYNGIERTEPFYFNLDEVELYKIQLEEVGGFKEMLQAIVEKKDIPKMIKVFEKIIDASYGVRSADGRNFYKEDVKPGILAEFKSTKAYSQIFLRFATDSDFAAEFVTNIVPADIAEKMKEYNTNPELAKVIDAKVVDMPKA